MLLLMVTFLPTLLHWGQALIHCNETVTKIRMCTLDSNYGNGRPPFKEGSPTMVKNSVTLFSLAQINEDQSTISLNVLLAFKWDDTRISLKSNNPDEYV